jgi:OOP family OmpA-OmpF porin
MKLSIALVALGVVSASAVATEDSGFYGSIGGGAYRLDADGFKDTAPTVKLVGGYDLNRYVAVEAGYSRLFETQDRVAGSNVKIDGNVWDIGTRVSYPITERIAPYGRLGWSYYDLKLKADTIEGRFSDKEKDDDFSWALGMSYALTDSIALRGEYSSIAVNGGTDPDFLSFNLTYQF